MNLIKVYKLITHTSKLVAFRSLIPVLVLAISVASPLRAQQSLKLSANWISAEDSFSNKPNTWIAFRKDISLTGKKPARAIAIIAADTKYWLWVNGELVVFEGGLKRGPNPQDTYCDRIDLSTYLKKGKNELAVLLWHFGKNGFSHVNSGKAGLLFQLDGDQVHLKSDPSWLCRIHPAYENTNAPQPNFRLAESNVRFNALHDISGWQTTPLAALDGFTPAKEMGKAGVAPWNKLIERPVPQWKNYGVKAVPFKRSPGAKQDTVIASLPYNMQMTPVVTVEDKQGGNQISINTDHSVAGGTNNVRAEYVTRKGVQHYESLGWMNGEKIILIMPKDVQLLEVSYRETGYNSEPAGAFTCSDPFYNRYWQKAGRTLYVNMRDNFFDCPDRERAQWWGDATLLMGECFYTYSTSTHALMRKAMDELCAWQRTTGELFSPIPGNFDKELPDQMLTSIGTYGFWNYYMNTGDRKQMEKAYPAVQKYLSLWQTDETGLTVMRRGGWLWGDWGENKDLRLIIAGWHYTALDGAAKMAELLGKQADAQHYRTIMDSVKDGFNRCWDGSAYRHPTYQGKTDDRAQALAVITGIADAARYAAILNIFKSEYHASPYMEKYVMEALFKMGEGTFALSRTKMRFSEMVDDPDHTTLYEGWGIGERGFGGGTTNHAWSGGAQIVIAESLFGIKPIEAGYRTFLVQPQPAGFTSGTLTVPSVKGMISTSFQNDRNGFIMRLSVPKGAKAVVKFPAGSQLLLNHKPVKGNFEAPTNGQISQVVTITLPPGNYHIAREQPL